MKAWLPSLDTEEGAEWAEKEDCNKDCKHDNAVPKDFFKAGH